MEKLVDSNWHYGIREEIRKATFFKDEALLKEDLDALHKAGLK